MKISDILVNSIKYPIDNDEDIINTAVLFGIPAVGLIILFLFAGIAGLFGENGGGIIAIGLIIAALLAFIFLLILPGYSLSVMDEGINQSNIIPSMNIGKNIVDTIKLLILGFIYSIIPAIIGSIIVFLFAIIGGAAGGVSGSESMGLTVSTFTWFGYFISALVSAFFTLLLLIATLRLARYDSLGAALSFGEVWADLNDLGIVKVLLLYALISIIGGLLITGSFALIGTFSVFAGALVILLLVLPVVFLFSSYALGLLYSEIA